MNAFAPIVAGAKWAGRRVKVLFTKYTTTGNVGAGNDTLWSVTIPAGLLANDGDSLELVVGLLMTGGVAGSTADINWNGVLVAQCSCTGGLVDVPVIYTMIIKRSGATAQVIIGSGTISEAGFGPVNTTGSATLSGTVVLSVTGQSLDGTTDEVRLTSGRVTYYPAP